MLTQTEAQTDETRRELLALLLASLACVFILTITVLDGRAADAPFSPGQLLMYALITGAVASGAGAVVLITQRARRTVRDLTDETADLRRELIMAEAVFRAEPQVLVFWEHGRGLRVITHTLKTVRGLPETKETLPNFGQWLDPRSAQELKQALDVLFEQGRAFSLFLKTKHGGDLEADGRAAGSRAILRFRDVVGYKTDLVRIIEQQRDLARDIKTCRSVLNALPMPVWQRDSQERLEWVNTAYVRAVEAETVAEVVAQQVELLEARQRQSLASGVQAGEAQKQRMHLLIGGDRKAHDVIVVPVEGVTASAAIDVAELESTQGELDAQTRAYDRTLDRVSTAIAIFNGDEQLTFFNDAYCRLWGLEAAWLEQGPTDGEILDRLRAGSRLPAMANFKTWRRDFLGTYETRKPIEEVWHLPDGRTLSIIGEPRPDGGMTYLYEDQTEQLSLESRYRTLNQVQSETLDSLSDGVAVFGTDGRLRLFNSAFADMWALSDTALAELPHIEGLVTEMAHLAPNAEHWKRLVAVVTALYGEDKALAGEMVRDDHSHIDVAAVALPDGSTLATFSDVTATRQGQKALEERNEALEAADRLKSRFISHVSYELRTPLTNIIGFSELLESPRTGELNQKQREYLTDISASSRTLLAIIDDILDIATIDAGALELQITEFDPKALIAAALDTVRDRAARMRVTLDVGLGDDVGTLEADEGRLRQVLFNLLSNAIGFSNAGDTVELSCWRDEDWVVFQIADQGIGISDDEQPNIFERFVSRSQGSKHRGAGLGLSIVKSLVELHGGTITLTSAQGVGTRVTFRLPARAERSLSGETLPRQLTA
ncbi:MAG: ATP-binding protein [Pseudomonadota bacterium]